MGRFESKFLKSWEFNPLVRYHYIDDVFLNWTHGWEKVESFSDELIYYYYFIIKLIQEFNNGHIPLLDRQSYSKYVEKN